MKRSIGFSLLLAALSLATTAQAGAFGGGDTESTAPAGGNYVVVYDSSVKAARVDEATGGLERSLDFDASYLYSRAVRGFAAHLSAADIAALREDPRVGIISRDRPVHATVAPVPLASGDLAPTGIQRVGASNGALVRGASDVSVAVIDSGIDLDHPDLNAAAGRNCIATGPPDDDNGHGTHVAGTIGARNNGSGVVGVAPGTRVYAVKVLDAAGEGTTASVLCGIDWVTANAAALNIKVANLSLGGDSVPSNCASEAFHFAICASTSAGITYVVAAGNDARDFGGSTPDIPASFPEVLTVTAMVDTDGQPGALGPSCVGLLPDDVAASFSNFATAAADAAHTIAAPGGCITSTFPGGYAIASGTSQASPHVAGAVAACLGEQSLAGPCTGMSTPQIIAKLRADATAHATVASGFVGDPFHPSGNRFYGDLAWVGLPPSATTAAATELAPTGAKLNALVTPNGQPTTFRFEYGRTTAYGSTTGAAGAGSGSVQRVVSAAIGGLQPATTYHFRVIASNPSGDVIGVDRTFRTAEPSPGFYRSYVACGLAKTASPSHVCDRGDRVGAFFQAQVPTTYTLCLRFPAGGTTCQRNLSVAASALRVNRLATGGVGAYRATWFVDGVVRGVWGFRIRRPG